MKPKIITIDGKKFELDGWTSDASLPPGKYTIKPYVEPVKIPSLLERAEKHYRDLQETGMEYEFSPKTIAIKAFQVGWSEARDYFQARASKRPAPWESNGFSLWEDPK